jgi:hypothetical protein
MSNRVNELPAIGGEASGNYQVQDPSPVASSSQMSEGPFLAPTEAARLYLLVWTPSLHQRGIMMSLSIISFMVALDACIIITSLNVTLFTPLSTTHY